MSTSDDCTPKHHFDYRVKTWTVWEWKCLDCPAVYHYQTYPNHSAKCFNCGSENCMIEEKQVEQISSL